MLFTNLDVLFISKSFKIIYLFFYSADAYVLQLQKYEMPPTPAVSQSSIKQPMKTASPRPGLSIKPPLSSPSPSHLPGKPTLVNMTAPTRTTALPAKIPASPIKYTAPSSGQQKTGPVVTRVQVQLPTPSTVTPSASPLKGVIHKTVANTASTPKQVATTQAVLHGTTPGVTTPQGLTLLRTPMQLPPGIHATMITNAKGVPMMKLEGPGLQGTSPVTLVTSQVGTAGIQGATIVRMAAPSIASTAIAASQNTTIKVVTTAATTTPTTAIKKIPVQSPVVKPPTTTAPSVIKQPLPVSLPANIPPGTQIKVLSPSGQITPIGAGVPLQIALQNIRAQLPPGMQLQQIKAGANTIFQAVPIATTKVPTTVTPTTIPSSPVQSTTVMSPSSNQQPIAGITKIPGATLISQLGQQLKAVQSMSSAPLATVGTPTTQIVKASITQPSSTATKVITTTAALRQATPTVSVPAPQVVASAVPLSKPPSLINPTVLPINIPTAAGVHGINAISSLTTSTLSSLTPAQMSLISSSSLTSSIVTRPAVTMPRSSTINTHPIIPVSLPLTRVSKAVTTPVVSAIKAPLVSSTVPSLKQAVPNVSSSIATTQKAPITASVHGSSSSLLPTAVTLPTTSKTALSVNGNITNTQATLNQPKVIAGQKVRENQKI